MAKAPNAEQDDYLHPGPAFNNIEKFRGFDFSLIEGKLTMATVPKIKVSKSEPKKYRVKVLGAPLTATAFEAVQWDGANWPWGDLDKRYQRDARESNGTVLVETADGQQTARTGDWIIKDTKHKLRVASDAQFRQTFVDDDGE